MTVHSPAHTFHRRALLRAGDVLLVVHAVPGPSPYNQGDVMNATRSPACQDSLCDQCDGRVVLNNNIYVCECACHVKEDAA